MTRLDEALVRAISVLDALGKSYALVGGIAASVLAAPRSTGDVDIAVAVADDGEAESVGQSFMAAADDWAEARQLAELVTARNSHRGRDLAASVTHLQAHGPF